MNIFEKLQMNACPEDIDLEMTQADTYGLLECRGDMQRGEAKKSGITIFI